MKFDLFYIKRNRNRRNAIEYLSKQKKLDIVKAESEKLRLVNTLFQGLQALALVKNRKEIPGQPPSYMDIFLNREGTGIIDYTTAIELYPELKSTFHDSMNNALKSLVGCKIETPSLDDSESLKLSIDILLGLTARIAYDKQQDTLN